MTKAVLAWLLLAFFLANPAWAGLDQARQDAALRLLEAMDMRVNLARTIDKLTQDEVDKNPAIRPFHGVMLDFMRKYMGYDGIKEDLARIYAEAFSQSEMEELARFYRTPLGRKMLEKMPELTVQGSRLGQRRVEQHLPELESMIAREVQRRKLQPAQ